MPGPYDYSIQQPNITGSLIGGIELGQAIAAQRQSQGQAEQYAQDLRNYLDNPSPQGAAEMSVKYPKQREAYKQSWDILSKDQQDQTFRAGTEAYSAIQKGKPDVAVGIIDKQIQAMENSGQDPTNLVKIKESIQQDPRSGGASIALGLSSLEPDRWSKIAGEMRKSELAPSELTESQAKASKAATDAKFAESKAVQDLTKGGWEINKLANDINISRQNSQIAAINSSISREKNDLKRQELGLKLDEKINKRDDAVREKAAKIESVRSTIDNSVGTIDRILKNPALNSVLGAVEGSSLYPSTLVGLLPGTASADDRANAEADIDTLKSQTFLNKLQEMKEASTTGASGLGGLTEKEGEKLVNGVQSLRTKQGEKQFRENLTEIQRLLMKNRVNLANKYGVPDTIPDTPQAQPSPDDIDALVRQYGGGQ